MTPPIDEGGKEAIYLHDVLLSDGTEKLKCFIAFPLNHLVQKNVVKYKKANFSISGNLKLIFAIFHDIIP